MDLAMMSTAQRDCELIANLATKCRGLRKSQVMGVSGNPTADQARELGNRFDMLAIPNPPWCRQRQDALVDDGLSPLSSLRQSMFCFVGTLGLVDKFARKDCQPGSECLFDPNGVGLNERTFLTENTVSPMRGFLR
jgi:hypothetical protein